MIRDPFADRPTAAMATSAPVGDYRLSGVFDELEGVLRQMQDINDRLVSLASRVFGDSPVHNRIHGPEAQAQIRKEPDGALEHIYSRLTSINEVLIQTREVVAILEEL